MLELFKTFVVSFDLFMLVGMLYASAAIVSRNKKKSLEEVELLKKNILILHEALAQTNVHPDKAYETQAVVRGAALIKALYDGIESAQKEGLLRENYLETKETLN